MTSSSQTLLTAAERLLAASDSPPWEALLDLLLRHFDCPVGTVHLATADGKLLNLAAQRGLPPPVLDKVGVIPFGKGMAGIAAERRAPVQVCNLQADDSGVVRPGAKMTQMEGSLAAPMLDGDHLFGVLGIAKPTAYDFTAAETQLLTAIGTLAARCSR